MISDRLYRHNTCMAPDPEEGCMDESVEFAQGGSAMIEKAKSVGRKGAKRRFRDTLRAARQNSSDPDDVGQMTEFANLKADLYMPRQERKEAMARYRELRKIARGDMSDDSLEEDPTARSTKEP